MSKPHRTPLLLALATLLAAWSLAFIAWETARTTDLARQQSEFESLVREKIYRVERRLGVYEQLLRATRGFLRNSVQVTADQYRAYVDNLNLDTYFPGIQGIGVAEIIRPDRNNGREARLGQTPDEIRVWPPGERSIYTAITRLEPLDAMNRRALGFDMYSEEVRRRAMARARDTGKAAMTGKVTLVQESGTDVQPGFLIYLPIYAAGMPTDTVAQRREAMLGWVYAPFRVHDFIESIEGLTRAELNLTLYDGTQASPGSCMYGCARQTAGDPRFQTQRTIEYGGQVWTLDLRSAPVFDESPNYGAPRLILGGGFVTGLLLAALVWALATGRNRALAEARRMTRELRHSHSTIEADQRRMRSMLESSLDAFVAMDSEGRISDWNAAATRLFGWLPEEAAGEDLARLIALQADGKSVGSITELLHPGDMRARLEVVARHRDGHEIPAELSLSTVRLGEGVIAHAFIRDLTAEKETQRREASQRRALDEARQALQHAQRLEAVGKLTGGVAHDFNNVLQIISGNIQLMQLTSGGDPRLGARLDSAMQAVDRGARLSSQLLSFARRQPLSPETVNLRELVHEARDLVQRAAGEEVEIAFVADQDLGNTVVDPARLENVLINLVINARDAMEGRGRLIVEVRNASLSPEDAASFPDVRPGEYIMLAVADTGSGMSAEVMEHAFEPFFTTKQQGAGTGLGLSMAYGFVRQSDGYIGLESEPGKGTVVRIYLPRTDEMPEASPRGDERDERDEMRDEEPADEAPDHGSAGPGGNETVLVVEDDPGVRATVAPLLSGMGYHVIVAENGDQASHLLREGHAFDLLFTDVVMPGTVSSTELARQARDRYPDLAVLFTSGYARDAIVHGGRLDPGVHLLSKPYRAEDLARKVRAVLDNRRKTEKTS